MAGGVVMHLDIGAAFLNAGAKGGMHRNALGPQDLAASGTKTAPPTTQTRAALRMAARSGDRSDLAGRQG